ncbi:MAG: DUF4433 domain-containing protein [Calothrix sp. MO_192.B10]|nr:DUF4433 domain-containing protein [Calothrix sp. MO_192.B10]
MPTPIYHITHVQNLFSIFQSGGLINNNRLKQQQVTYQNIAHVNIQDRRALIRVPCAAGGHLHDYVPFYFAPRSPMLYTIHKGNVQGYSGGQDLIVYLVAEAELIESQKLEFAFTDGHAVMAYINFYDNLQQLNVIDWKLMKSRYWFNTEDDPDRKCRRQAEFLVHQFCPWPLITEIGVKDNAAQSQVQRILQNFHLQTPVKVHSDWYY